MSAFFTELEKLSSETIGAPRSKLPGFQGPKAPTAPGSLAPKNTMPGGYGKRQNYSQPNVSSPAEFNPTQGIGARQQPPPNVVFGVR